MSDAPVNEPRQKYVPLPRPYERRHSDPTIHDISIDLDDNPDGSDGGYGRHGNYVSPEVMMEIVRLRVEVEKLQAGISAVETLINNSEGVIGLHLNGDVAPWADILAGGRFEGWLAPFSAALSGGEHE